MLGSTPELEHELVELCERHVIELLSMLQRDGWTNQVWTSSRAAKPKTKSLAPYILGGDKVWYLHRNATKFNALYFECLLQVVKLRYDMFEMLASLHCIS